VQLNHVRKGSGDPLLLIHGLGSQYQVWQPVIDRLAEEREVIGVDLPGFGGSPAFPDDVEPNAGNFADAVAGFLDGIGWDKPHVAGNSLGGWTALELAKRGRARTVAGVGSAGFAIPREVAFSTHSLRLTHRSAQLIYGAAPTLFASPLRRRLMLGQVFYRADRMTPEAAVEATRNFADSPGVDRTLDWIRTDQFRGGEQIDVPVTMIWGDHEMLMPRRERLAARAERAIPGARTVWLKGCGHTPTWDDPPALAQAILDATRAS
jgi:pimeloyl-ACP methyl ester carboxylesterase